jgi:hypothetical protein
VVTNTLSDNVINLYVNIVFIILTPICSLFEIKFLKYNLTRCWDESWGVTNARSERLLQRFLVSIFCCVWSNIPLRNLGQKLAGIILL